MTSSITEWEFTPDVASWINEILLLDSSPPFSRAKCEQRGKGSWKRRDLTLLDRDRSVALTGEVKLPFRADGGSPYNEKMIQDARAKAVRAKTDYFFTWNVNECVLWETFPPKTTHRDRKYKTWEVTSISQENHLEHPMIINDIKRWLPIFLNDFAEILRGKAQLGLKSPDERFIEALESSLRMPISLTLEGLVERYRNSLFKSKLDKWMRNDQGWLISDDPRDIRDNLERASKFACYALVNKLVFYEAMLKRYGKRIAKISVPDHIERGDDLRLHLESYFFRAKKETGDYETVFGEDHKEIGNLIPFYSDSAVVHWRQLIDAIHQFDFSKLDYEVIGNIFERLISPEERHKYGQFYTSPQVVDLINSFCIRRGDEKVMDPACGGGTFLVRAYVRKRNLMPGRTHAELLSDLCGIDISHFATHLTTINLATRDLIDDRNYPQIARSDFFDVRYGKPFLLLPNKAGGVRVKTEGMGKSQHREIEIPALDAVVGNPPYVRQEDIPRDRQGKAKPRRGTKEYYTKLIEDEWKGINLSGRSDLHCYFWPHAATFLKKDGYLCLLTSSQWLDVEYGFKLQKWILENFEILAIFESISEPWFVGARVVTTITILHRQPEGSKRMNNIVRFVQLRRPMKEILTHNGTSAGEITVADEFRDEIFGLKNDTVNDRYRTRLVHQRDLWDEGIKLGVIFGEGGAIQNLEQCDLHVGDYFGGKWGVYLRAPDLWFELQTETRGKWSHLGEIAEVRYGVKSGRDEFFYVRDVTMEYLEKFVTAAEFKEQVRYPREDFTSGKARLVRCGKGYGELRAIETTYLEPEVHSLMEICRYSATAKDCKRLILLIDEKQKQLKSSYVLEYINWGESKGWHKGSTCAARVSQDRTWYDLTGHRRAPVLWPKERQYRHIALSNDERIIANCRLYEIYPPDEFDDPDLWGGILNSSWTLLSSLQFGRPVGNEGGWSTMVVDVNMMLVADPRYSTNKELERVKNAFKKMKNREALSFLSERRLKHMAYTQAGKAEQLGKLSDLCELNMEDRRELDDAVLEMIGVGSKERRSELIERLYDYLREFFELTRQKEEKAIENKKRAKRRGPARPGEIAAQIFQEITEKEPHWLHKYDPDFVDTNKLFDVFELPEKGKPEIYKDLFVKHAVRFVMRKKDGEIIKTKIDSQAPLVCLVAQSGQRGLIRFPHEAQECQAVRDRYGTFIKDRNRRLFQLVKERTADEEMQTKILDALMLFLNK